MVKRGDGSQLVNRINYRQEIVWGLLIQLETIKKIMEPGTIMVRMRAFPTKPKKRFMRNCGELKGNGCGKRFRPTGKYSELCEECWMKKRSSGGIRVTKTLHKVWVERNEAAKKGIKIRRLMGKWQYIYKCGDKQVSLIQTIPPRLDFKGKFVWELGIPPKKMKGKWTIEQFTTKKKAYERIREILL